MVGHAHGHVYGPGHGHGRWPWAMAFGHGQMKPIEHDYVFGVVVTASKKSLEKPHIVDLVFFWFFVDKFHWHTLVQFSDGEGAQCYEPFFG